MKKIKWLRTDVRVYVGANVQTGLIYLTLCSWESIIVASVAQNIQSQDGLSQKSPRKLVKMKIPGSYPRITG